jgi:GDP/UDP-N,N'-diacetylbacillosamine 2-epimerase (hydrolysing)
MGEDPNRVFNYGSTSIDNILKLSNLELTDVLESINLAPCKYAVCTYHPVTMEKEDVETQIHHFLNAIKRFPQIEFIVTKSNADQGGDKINEILDREEKAIDNMHVYTSLGVKRYLSLMNHAEFVLGNSSSGIVETPAFHIPTINIGDRQKGRLQSKSIINCLPTTESIIDAISYAMSEQMKTQSKNVISPYGDGAAALKVAKKSVEVVLEGNLDLKKKFYNVEVSK